MSSASEDREKAIESYYYKHVTKYQKKQLKYSKRGGRITFCYNQFNVDFSNYIHVWTEIKNNNNKKFKNP